MRASPKVAQVCALREKWIGCPNCNRASIEAAQVVYELIDPFRDFRSFLTPCAMLIPRFDLSIIHGQRIDCESGRSIEI